MKKAQQLLLLIFLIFIWNQTIVKADTNSDPSIVSVSPNIVQQGDTVDFVIKGRNTHFTKGYNDVRIYSQKSIYYSYPLSQTVINDSIITAKFRLYYQLEPNLFHVVVSPVGDGELKLENCINLLAGPSPPSFISTPSTGAQGETVHFDIKGTNTHFLKANVGLNGISLYNAGKFNSKQATDVVYVNDTVLKATFYFDYKDSVGKYNVYINDFHPAPPLILIDGFTLTKGPKPPTINSISPSTATQGSSVTLRIKGSNTHFLTGTYKISIGGQEPSALQLINDSIMDVDFKFTYLLSPGSYSLQVKNSTDGPLNLSNAFTLTAGPYPPSLKSITPSYGRHGDTLTMTIVGKNTFFKLDNGIELWNKYGRYILPNTIKYINDSLLESIFVFSKVDSIGEYDVWVNGYDFCPRLKLPKAFTLYSGGASIVSVSPATATIGNSIEITVHSLYAHYLSGTNTMQLKSIYGGPPVLGSNVTVMNDSTLSATFSFTNSNFSGKYSMIVNNTVDGQIKMDSVFTLKSQPGTPYIVRAYPKTVPYGYAVTITFWATGTHFQQGLDTIMLSSWPKEIYPLSMSVENDTTIKVSFDKLPIPAFMGAEEFDVVIWGTHPLVLNKGVVVYIPVRIAQVDEQTAVAVYPNPSGGIFNINLDQAMEIKEIEVMDLTGRIIHRQNKLSDLIQIDISSYANGMYYLRLLGANATKNIKIIKE